MTKVYLKRKISNRIANGHPWIFNNEIDRIDDLVNGGEIVEVLTHDKKSVGKGYINPKSQILVRLLTRNKQDEINEEFFHRRIKQCWEYRKTLGYTENCRLVFGEADELPQLINILSGEMSFVGPRPERHMFVDELAARIPLYRERHMVKAGLTGWAQVNYPYGASVDDARSKLSYDLYYVKNFSILFDFVILLQTLRVVLWPSGVR